MDSLLQRLTDLATASLLLPAREQAVSHAPDGSAFRMPPTARSMARWALWLGFLALPGSFLLLPVLFWGKIRQPRESIRRALSTTARPNT
ncbi:MAG: hypothetical protein ABWY07_02985 [Burkholderiales bacterium]